MDCSYPAITRAYRAKSENLPWTTDVPGWLTNMFVERAARVGAVPERVASHFSYMVSEPELCVDRIVWKWDGLDPRHLRDAVRWVSDLAIREVRGD